ncbi:MAG: alpha/beta hydrolase, partial [Gammaproteobacteria bacterium]|nr:alpha/beta hydrolase [Gammaproteobacteria bacterium]
MNERSSEHDQRPCVVLLHGLARSARAMRKLEKNLQQDYLVINQTYPSRKYPIEQLAKIAISPAISRCGKLRTINFVTHSLGGILVRQYLRQHPLANLGRTVMLGPPNQGSELSDYFAKKRLFNFYNGPSGAQLGTNRTSVPCMLGKVDFDLGVIAGSR